MIQKALPHVLRFFFLFLSVFVQTGWSLLQSHFFDGFLGILKGILKLVRRHLFAGMNDLEQAEYIHQQKARLFNDTLMEKVVVGSTAVVSTSMSVGYVVWMLRGGSLLTTFLSSLPVWQAFDPLPVLESFDQSDADTEDSESLLTLVSRG